jgi:hypothetical protein
MILPALLALLLRYARSIGIREAEAHIAAGNHPSRRVQKRPDSSRSAPSPNKTALT